MKMKSLLSAGLGALALGLVATSAQAAPAGGLVGAMDQDAARHSPVENVTWYGRRNCHWHYGYRHCGYGYGYGYGHRYRGWDDYGYGYGRPYRRYYGYGYPYRYHYGYGHRRWSY